VNEVAFIAAVVFGFMLAEQRMSRRNERQLRAAGAVEAPNDVYRALALVYPSAFLVMAIEGLWRAAGTEASPAGGPSWMASGVLLFAASKALKYWAIRALGERWSFRVLVEPGRPLVATGPYAYIAHPNYVAVIGELAGAAMMVNAPISGPIMMVLFALVLRRRIRVESLALAASGRQRPPTRSNRSGTALPATGQDRKA
jgi:methyltransferase